MQGSVCYEKTFDHCVDGVVIDPRSYFNNYIYIYIYDSILYMNKRDC